MNLQCGITMGNKVRISNGKEVMYLEPNVAVIQRLAEMLVVIASVIDGSKERG